MDNLFEQDEQDCNVILLVDASGSVSQAYMNSMSIFDRIEKFITNEIKQENMRIIFWNSNNCNNTVFKNGTFSPPFAIKRNTIRTLFQHTKSQINSYCLTTPHLGFDKFNINRVDNGKRTQIYFITDGEIGYNDISFFEKNKLKYELKESIINTFTQHNHIQLIIVTFEANNRNFSKIESLKHAAGCDVYNVIMDNKLTKYVSKFISYTPNNDTGFIHINKNSN